MAETPISRRTLLKLAAVGAGTVVAEQIGVRAIEAFGKAIGKTFEGLNQLPDNILNPVTVPSSKEAEADWRKVYRVGPGDTISSIAKRFYPDFDNNQPFYIAKIRFANEQAPEKNALIYAGQVIYIPDPRIPALGFAAGESVVLRGKEIDGKYLPTTVGTIDLKAKTMEVYFHDNTVFKGALKVGEKLSTDRPLGIAAVLEGGPTASVPPRVVLEIIG